jgi:hypothetical protein
VFTVGGRRPGGLGVERPIWPYIRELRQPYRQ